jgi:hypothetical protein
VTWAGPSAWLGDVPVVINAGTAVVRLFGCPQHLAILQRVVAHQLFLQIPAPFGSATNGGRALAAAPRSAITERVHPSRLSRVPRFAQL